MDRYHLAWLMVGKPTDVIRGRAMTAEEEAAYVRAVADQKTAALRMSLDAAEARRCRSSARPAEWGRAGREPVVARGSAPAFPARPVTERVAEARRQADEHRDHDAPRAPRPDRMQR